MKKSAAQCLIRALLLATLLSGTSGCQRIFGVRGAGEHLRAAEEATRKGDITAAIESYRRHIAYRLSLAERPEWENPSFYELMIGDLELRRGDVAAALGAFERAETAGIERGLVSDRFRATGTWLEQNGREVEALELLKKYRDRDPLLFDAMLDRIAKEVTRKEELPGASPLSTPLPLNGGGDALP
jgi:hypothetical protein